MKLALLSVFLALPLLAQNPKPCTNVTNSATAGYVLSATSAGSTPPCRWISAGGGGSGSVTSVAASNGLTATPNPITTTGTISGINAGADGATKGVAAFTALDFNASAGVISIDYTNGQKATALQPGFLTAADWTTFNSKQAAGSYVLTTRSIATTAPLAGGGDLSADRTFTCNVASGSQPGCLSAADWTTFNGKGAGTVTSIATTSPITGGTITSTGTIACATCVVASSPGVGIAHFAGSTQTVTSSLIVAADITSATITGTQIASSIALAGSPTTTTQTAADNSTKIATTAYVNHCGGVSGTALFSPKTGTISGLVMCGTVTNVTRSSAGVYSVTLTSPPTNIQLALSNSDDGADTIFCYPGGSTTSIASPVTIGCVRRATGVASDPGFVTFTLIGY